MLHNGRRIGWASILMLMTVGTTGPAWGQSAQGKFYEGYYLERAEGDVAAAATRYEEVVSDRRANGAIRAKAEARLTACREELASADFASLMPETTIIYAELTNPGDQVMGLLRQLGLLAEEGELRTEPEQRVAISPGLIKAVLGIRGAAVAVTAIDPTRGEPAGVLVFHPGDMELIRGLIETGLPIGGQPVEPIESYPTYSIEGEVLATLTSRLVIVSPQRSQIEAVLDRLTGKERRSLATNKDMAGVLAGRDDSLLFFSVNARPLLPMLNGMMAAGGGANQEIAIARAVLDIDSLQSLVGKIGVSDDGVFLDLALQLDEGHKNLVYNLLRMPPISWDTLKAIPEGAAGFVAGALNDTPSRFANQDADQAAEPIVTALDFGREIFANITTFAVFALPSERGNGQGNRRGIVPDMAAVLTVRDPAKSRALWTQVLGIASMANNGGQSQPRTTEIRGVPVHSYPLPEDVTIHLATIDHDLLLATTPSAMSRSIEARRGGRTILDDPAFTKTLSRLGTDTTKAIVVHPARCMAIAKPFMSEREAAEVAPFLGPMHETVASLMVDHSADVFHVGFKVTGIPKIGGLLSDMIREETGRHQAKRELHQALKSKQWEKGLGLIDSALDGDPDNYDLYIKKLRVLAVGLNDREAARVVIDHIGSVFQDDANRLNHLAWDLLTEDRFGGAFDQEALQLSARSNELTHYDNWLYLDTLALAMFKTGEYAKAVDLQQKAVKLAGNSGGKGPKERLAQFERALAESKLAGSK